MVVVYGENIISKGFEVSIAYWEIKESSLGGVGSLFGEVIIIVFKGCYFYVRYFVLSKYFI